MILEQIEKILCAILPYPTHYSHTLSLLRNDYIFRYAQTGRVDSKILDPGLY